MPGSERLQEPSAALFCIDILANMPAADVLPARSFARSQLAAEFRDKASCESHLTAASPAPCFSGSESAEAARPPPQPLYANPAAAIENSPRINSAPGYGPGPFQGRVTAATLIGPACRRLPLRCSGSFRRCCCRGRKAGRSGPRHPGSRSTYPRKFPRSPCPGRCPGRLSCRSRC